jgi:hypothetical protein
MQPLINGIARSWSQITVPFLGSPLSGVISINWSIERVKTNNPGIGSYASSRGQGNWMFTASMTLLMEEWDRIVKASPNGKPQSIPFFDLPILFIDEPTGGLIKKVVWKSAEIMTASTVGNQGDTQFPIEVTFLVADIQENPL